MSKSPKKNKNTAQTTATESQESAIATLEIATEEPATVTIETPAPAEVKSEEKKPIVLARTKGGKFPGRVAESLRATKGSIKISTNEVLVENEKGKSTKVRTYTLTHSAPDGTITPITHETLNKIEEAKNAARDASIQFNCAFKMENDYDRWNRK